MWDERARKWLLGRKHYFTRLRQSLAVKQEQRIWMHCASLGEFEQGRPVLELLRQQYPSAVIILTFFSPSGYDVRKDYDQADHVFYLPLDTANNARQFIATVQPDIALFVKYEFWYHFLKALKEAQVPTILLAAIFRKEQIFFKWYGGIFRKMLQWYSFIFMQDDHSAQIISELGIDNAHFAIAPDPRFDRVWQIASQPAELVDVAAFINGKPVLVAGSTWPADHQMLKDVKLGNGKMIIAPHQIAEDQIRTLEGSFQGRAVRFSDFGKAEGEKTVLLIDSIGMLASLYHYADVSYVGGGFGNGIHNTLEPAAHGVPVLFGPRFGKFNEAKKLLDVGAAISTNDKKSMAGRISQLLKDKRGREQMGKAAKTYVSQNRGGSKMIIQQAAAYL